MPPALGAVVDDLQMPTVCPHTEQIRRRRRRSFSVTITPF